MSYQDPYAAPQNYLPNPYNTGAPSGGQPGGYGAHEPEVPDGEFNPYEQHQPRYPTYDQQPYSDHPGAGPAPYADYGTGYVGREKEFNQVRVSVGPPPKNTGMLRIWRRDGRGKQWTRGGGCRSFCRFFCCFIMSFIFILLAVVLSLVAFVRPPDVTFNGVTTPTDGSLFTQSGPDAFVVNLDLNIAVRNPNFFDVDFNSISAKLFYPGYSQQLGTGEVDNIVFKSNTATTFNFPISLNYSTTADPTLGILTSIGTKCGLGGGAQSDIEVNFTLNLALKILFAQITPTVSSSAGFACPFTSEEINGVIGQILGGGTA